MPANLELQARGADHPDGGVSSPHVPDEIGPPMGDAPLGVLADPEHHDLAGDIHDDDGIYVSELIQQNATINETDTPPQNQASPDLSGAPPSPFLPRYSEIPPLAVAGTPVTRLIGRTVVLHPGDDPVLLLPKDARRRSLKIRAVGQSVQQQVQIVVPNPAAGNQWLWTVPNGIAYRLVSVKFDLITSAVVANRTASLAMTDFLTYYFAGDSTVQTASQTRTYEFAPNAPSNQGAFSFPPQVTATPGNAILMPGHTLGSLIQNLDAGDTFNFIILELQPINALGFVYNVGSDKSEVQAGYGACAQFVAGEMVDFATQDGAHTGAIWVNVPTTDAAGNSQGATSYMAITAEATTL